MNPKTLIGPLAAALLATTLSGCFQFNSGASPGLPAQLPRDCQRLAVKVPEPKANEGDDILDIAGRYRAAWLKGNHRIAAIRSCDDKQADAVAEGAR